MTPAEGSLSLPEELDALLDELLDELELALLDGLSSLASPAPQALRKIEARPANRHWVDFIGSPFDWVE